MRAARLRTCRMPRSPRRTRSPFFSDLVTAAKKSSNSATVDFFCSSFFSASMVAICLAVVVTVLVAAALAMVSLLRKVKSLVFCESGVVSRILHSTASGCCPSGNAKNPLVMRVCDTPPESEPPTMRVLRRLPRLPAGAGPHPGGDQEGEHRQDAAGHHRPDHRVLAGVDILPVADDDRRRRADQHLERARQPGRRSRRPGVDRDGAR